MINYYIVAGLGNNRELGLNNELLWRLPEDLKNFKALTIGKSMIMGRKTFESIGRPLPKRETIILTRDTSYKQDGCVVFNSVEEIEKYLLDSGKSEAAVVGGGEVYKLYLSKVKRMYLSFVDFDGEADTFFPEVDYSIWTEESVVEHAAGEKTPAWKFVEYSRI
ncbi:dihydrofolate reductase [Halobacteriovorax sp.]|uniref:dihydrofolate reductase n=1 Tax=Halobacteriovorax sp. TaxID=2020862 RepID=UPI0035633F69